MFCLQNKFFSLFALLIYFFVLQSINTVHAANKATKEKQQTIDINAHYLMLDEKAGVSKYNGNVLFTKGTLSIKADTVTLFYTDEKLTRALITGSPADVHHEPDNEAKVHSQANEMEYFVAEDKLTLKGQAFVDQGNRHFSGEYIEYDTRQRIVIAAGNQNSVGNTENSNNNTTNNPTNSRVHVIIGPNEDVKDNKAITSDEESIKNE